MELIVAYLVGFVLVVGAFAVRAPDVESPTLFLIAASWPLSMLFALFIYLLTIVGADLDVQDSPKMFGFRKPTNPNVKGFAVTVFHSEVQFWKRKKA
jgi:prepilin signal peptidase PulO-like enzyme (type II secretory pathway)